MQIQYSWLLAADRLNELIDEPGEAKRLAEILQAALYNSFGDQLEAIER